MKVEPGELWELTSSVSDRDPWYYLALDDGRFLTVWRSGRLEGNDLLVKELNFSSSVVLWKRVV